MKIRLTTFQDVERVIKIYEHARRFMAASGNPGQWTDGYPDRQVLLRDMERESSYVVEDREGRVCGTFCFFKGVEPNYLDIYEGEWLNDLPYGVIHRLASDGTRKGMAGECIAWCFSRCPNLRADTHRDNVIMQHLLEKNGFVKCGTIRVENGTLRLAFQKTLE